MFRNTLLTAALVTAVFAAVSARSASPEPRQRDFVILNDDGYGTSDCLTKESSCGKIVADAWCESKGFARAVSYRPAEAGDITHSAALRNPQMNETFVISCAE